MTKDGNDLEGEDALALIRQGREVWNEWAESHPGWRVDFSRVDFGAEENSPIRFDLLEFPGTTSFREAIFDSSDIFYGTKFSGWVYFDKAIFSGSASFLGTKFSKGASFNDATFSESTHFMIASFTGQTSFIRTTFNGEAVFTGTEFGKETNFDNATFNGVATFVGATFGYVNFSQATFKEAASFHSSVFNSALVQDGTIFEMVPDFQSTKINHHVSMDSLRVGFEGKRLLVFWEQGSDQKDAPKYRRLKEMAILAQDHRQEQEFFALELKSMRGSRVNGVALYPGLLYETLSNFGRSLMRPMFGLLFTWVIFAMINISVSQDSHEIAPPVTRIASAAFIYSGAQIFPFISGTGDARSWALSQLYDRGVPGFVHSLNILEGLLALVFLFLVGLALRNRFRI